MAKIAINLKEGTLKKETSNIIIGIDLGTTNSIVAYVSDGNAIAVKEKNGKNTLVPSIVHFTKEGGILVGEKAKSELVAAPERTIYSCLLYTSPSPRDRQKSRMPSSA